MHYMNVPTRKFVKESAEWFKSKVNFFLKSRVDRLK